MKRRIVIAGALSLLASFQAAAQSVPANSSTVLAPFAGRDYTPAPGLENIGFYGTDLGYTFKHAGHMRILFGDTARSPLIDPISPWTEPPRDDAQGLICMQYSGCLFGAPVFARGNDVDAYVQSHQGGAGEPAWHDEAPPIWWRYGLDGLIASQHPYRGGTQILGQGPFRTPLGAFSNARVGSTSAAFAVFGRGVKLQCTPGNPPTCPNNYQCDPGLGTVNGDLGEDAEPCFVHPAFPDCHAANGGMCVDTGNHVYDRSAIGPLLSIVNKHEVGNADPAIHEIYYTRSWNTNRFSNLAVRTVNDFSPLRAYGVGNDYRLPDSLTTFRERVFLWGRPGFFGLQSQNSSMKVFFAYVDMPSYSAWGNFDWTVNYFTGLNVFGVPQFSTNPNLARPLDLSGLADGLATADTEKWDVVNQMSVAYVASLGKWVMLYGGDTIRGILAPETQYDPEGAIHVRFASQPWGPWTRPYQLFVGGNPNAAPANQFAPGGILHHPDCVVPLCAADEAQSDPPRDFGFLYGANLIAEWSEDRGSYTDIYWNVSTWNPYQVVLMRSRIDE